MQSVGTLCRKRASRCFRRAGLGRSTAAMPIRLVIDWPTVVAVCLAPYGRNGTTLIKVAPLDYVTPILSLFQV
jgi:hypothetical protein